MLLAPEAARSRGPLDQGKTAFGRSPTNDGPTSRTTDHLGCSEGHQKAIWIIEPSCVKMYKEAYCLFNNISIFEDTLRLKEMLK